MRPMTFDEIAAEMDMPASQIEAIYYRGMHKLRARLSPSIAQKGRKMLAEIDGGTTEFRVVSPRGGVRHA